MNIAVLMFVNLTPEYFCKILIQIYIAISFKNNKFQSFVWFGLSPKASKGPGIR